MVTTESMTDLPLPRIGQAIRAVLDDLYLLPVAYGRSDVVSKTRGWCHQGTHDEAIAYIDARCAEAAVRALQFPSDAMIEAAFEATALDDAWCIDCSEHWSKSFNAALNAMLSETQS